MSRKRKGNALRPMVLPVLLVWWVVIPSPWDLTLLIPMGAFLVVEMRSLIAGDKEVRAERQKEIEKAKTRELELQLGLEPLDFSELSDDEVNRLYEEMKKEKGT